MDMMSVTKLYEYLLRLIIVSKLIFKLIISLFWRITDVCMTEILYNDCKLNQSLIIHEFHKVTL